MEQQQNAQPSPAPAAAPAAPEAPSGLEKVYADFKIEDTASQFQPQSQEPAAPPVTPAPKVPDPFDPNFAAYQAQLAQGVTALSQATNQAVQKLTALERQIQHREVEADIKQAATALAEKSGLKPKIAEVAMEARAREDARFAAIWRNRKQNPKALAAAIDALSGELKEEYSVKQDPQLLENQRAVKASQQQSATTQKATPNDEFEGMSPNERQAYVRRKYINGG